MSLSDVISAVESQRKTLTVFNPDDDSLVGDVRDYFGTQNVTVEVERTETGRPGGFAVLSRGGEYLTAVSWSDLKRLIHETPSGPDGVGVDDSEYYELLQYLKETTFTSYSIADMVRTSREIEDRAWRVGEGRLYAGFQYFSTLRDERQTYQDLSKKHLDIHVYAAPDTETPPDVGDVTLHAETSDEIERSWFVVYDGAGDDLRKCALLAEEREPREFYGFWTYNPEIVDRIVDHLDRRYGVVSA